MKQYYFKAGIILFFAAMLLFPKQVFTGASNGLLLWFNSVLPTLLPFMIVSNLLIQTHAVNWIVRITGPALRHIFQTSDYGSFAVVTGFLCGYPMGSKVTTDLLREGHIDLPEAKYLLSFCNNASPVFIISYIVLQNLSNEKLLAPGLVILMGSPILASFLFRLCIPGLRLKKIKNKKQQNSFGGGAVPSENLMDTCIMSAFEMITKVGGYIILFSILLSIAQMVNIPNDLFRFLLLPSLEITNGISFLCASVFSEPVKFFLSMICASFGGWCAAAQTRCMIARTGLSIKPYIAQKLITAMVTSLLCLFYLYFIY